MTNGSVRILPLGGLGEVGKNMTVFEQDGELVLIDAGLTFPRTEMPGIDLVLPDFTYVTDRADRLRAVILTHGHEDHVGALPYLLRRTGPGPVVWGTRLTLGLVKSRLDEHGLLVNTSFEEIDPTGRPVQIGPFRAEFARVTHSIPDAVAVALHTAAGTIVHTGDFKLDAEPIDGRPTDLERLGALGRAGVALLLSDSTNAERPGTTPSERTVGASLREIIRNAPGRVIVTSFASQIHRLQQAIDAAVANRRQVCVIGRSMTKYLNISRNLGYADVADDVLIRPRQLDEVPDDRVVVLCTGSQGEPQSALTRIAFGEHPALRIEETDTVIMSSRAVPGNEVKVHETINRLSRQGATVLTEETAYVHVSGHAAHDDLRAMLSLVRPRAFVPVHGEHRMLRAHARIAEEVGVPRHAVKIIENGDVLELDDEGITVVDRVEAGPMLVDGLNVADVRDVVLRDRRHLASDGVLIVVATISSETAEELTEPEVIARGFEPPGNGGYELIEDARTTVARVLEECHEKRTTEVHLVQQHLHDALAELVRERTGKRPMVLPVVVEV
jgi:ribonuclease J